MFELLYLKIYSIMEKFLVSVNWKERILRYSLKLIIDCLNWIINVHYYFCLHNKYFTILQTRNKQKEKQTHQYHLEHLQVFMNSFKGQKITEN